MIKTLYALCIFAALMAAVNVGVILGMRQQAPAQPLGEINSFSSATNSSVNVSAATSTTVFSAGDVSYYAAIVNNSTNTVWCYLGANAAANKGIRLNSSGGSYELTPDNLFLGPVSCIADSATSTLTVSYK